MRELTTSTAHGGPGSSAISAGSRASAQAGAEALRAGGNAVDAVLAATLAATVSEQAMTSLGGGGFLLVRQPDGAVHLRDFFVDTPGRGLPVGQLDMHFLPIGIEFPGSVVQHFHFGKGSVAVPGVLAGLLSAHAEFARLPLEPIVAPARRYAVQGVAMEPVQETMGGLIRDMVALSEESRSLIQRDGRWLVAGDLIRNADLAMFLDRIVSGEVTGQTSPGFAIPLLEAMSEGGLITAADLEAYRVISRVPIVTRRAGWDAITNPPPSFGGPIIADTLAIAPPTDPDDPSHWCALLSGLIRATEHHRSGGLVRLSGRGTTHVSVVDGDGMVAGLTSSMGESSGFVIPGTGIQLNNMLGEDDLNPDGFHVNPPGLRLGSMMSPSMLIGPDESVVAMGTGGSERIRSSLVEVMIRMIDCSQPLDDAIRGPRIDPNADGLQVEPQLGAGFIDGLIACWPGVVNEWPDTSVYFGGVNAVQLHGDGSVTAVADGRRGGHALVLEP